MQYLPLYVACAIVGLTTGMTLQPLWLAIVVSGIACMAIGFVYTAVVGGDGE